MHVERLHNSHHPYFASLLGIYEEAFPASERKPAALLAQMIERAEYCFLGLVKENSIVGFSISIALRNTSAGLLEYMAVDAHYRGHGLGHELFLATVSYPRLAELRLLIEVDSDQNPNAPGDAARRKAFYRRHGCREIKGLAYRMPRVANVDPPPMEMLLYSSLMTDNVSRSELRDWLDACYHQVYGVLPDDGRIEAMLRNLDSLVQLV